MMPHPSFQNANPTPRQMGYYFPAEFEKHDATWLSWPHKEASWPGRISSIFPRYAEFVSEIAKSEKVCINVNDEAMKIFATEYLQRANADMTMIQFCIHPTNDAWCRDHGPAFLINPKAADPKIVVDWNYNAWGDKYPPYDLDDIIPTCVAKHRNIPVIYPGIIMEGGSVEFNGNGTILTSSACLLNPNRNPHLNQAEIEEYLREYYGAEQILWISEGIVGDDTDGHIDDTVRFVNKNTVLAVTETNRLDDNYDLLNSNIEELKKLRLSDGTPLDIIELPMPDPVIYEDQRLPASYANFYITNGSVIVPTFNCSKDDQALKIISECFPGRQTVGIDSTEIIWGLGSFHCLSQQEPAIN